MIRPTSFIAGETKPLALKAMQSQKPFISTTFTSDCFTKVALEV